MSHNGINHRYCKWPLGTPVLVNTPGGYLTGTVNRHQKEARYRHGCDIAFSVVVDLGDANGPRLCHHIPFRNIRKVNPQPRLARPWYKEPRYDFKV